MDHNRKTQYKQREPYNYVDNTVIIIFANASQWKFGQIRIVHILLMQVFIKLQPWQAV